ncbi:MAG: hypothetical protein HN704_04935 [Bacteroidetes bacterium]|nr:hypothetical protein [Bacteroidota bacterium]MBT7143550.1 hypothetical protein [Bacteroidota bacterium]MBT7490937.1 hypothetical protein [Bacteroidota bacterium]
MRTIYRFVILFYLTLIPVVLHASIEVVGKLKHVKTGNSGDIYKGRIKIQNSGDYAQEVRVYQTDLLYNYEDYTLYDPPVTHNRSNANWIQYSPKTTIVNAKETQFIQYEVSIPKNDTISGTYWSVLMVEGVNPIDPNEEGKLNINTITRYAIQIVTEIGDKGLGELQFMEPTIINEGGKIFLAIDIINSGDHYISPEVSLELYDENGVSMKKIEAGRKGIFPTTSTRFRVDLEGIEGNKTYQAIIIAAGKDDDVFGIEYTLYF